jgi:hypothetical protein
LGLWGEFLKSHFSKLIFYVFFFTFAFKAPVAHGFGTVGEVAEKPCAAKLVGKPITKFRIGSLNVENVFDPIVDTNQKDKQFVPNAVRLLPFGPRGNKTGNIDWTREKLAIKVGQIARMVKGMGSPELMAMVELENNLVAREILNAIGYDGYLMTHSPDERGVDVALFYKETPNFQLRFRGRTVLKGEFYDAHASRDILEAGFVINQRHFLWGYVNHWPSQMGPAEARVQAAQQLMAQAELRTLQMEGIDPESGYDLTPNIFALGDFNVIDKDNPHPFARILQASNQPVPFYDVGSEFRKSRKVSKKIKESIPPGTYYYVDPKGKNGEGKKTKTGTWNELDRIFVNSALLNAKNAIHVDPTSYQIIAPRFASMQWTLDSGEKIWIPRPYDFSAEEVSETTGVSDHFGIVVDVIVEN